MDEWEVEVSSVKSWSYAQGRWRFAIREADASTVDDDRMLFAVPDCFDPELRLFYKNIGHRVFARYRQYHGQPYGFLLGMSIDVPDPAERTWLLLTHWRG